MFGVLGHGLTAFVFISTSFGLFLWLVHVWTRGQPLSSKLNTSVTLLPLNLSALLVLDRGNVLLVAIPLLGIASYRILIEEDKGIWPVVCLAVAASLKPNLLIPVVCILFIGQKKFGASVKFFTIFATMNLILMYSYSDSLFSNFINLVSVALESLKQEHMQAAGRTGSSFYDLIQLTFNRWPMINPEMSLLGIMAGLVWLRLVIAVLVMKQVPLWMRIVAAFSTIQMVIPGSPYVLVWSVMAALALPSKYETKEWRSPTIAMLVTAAMLINNLPIPNQLILSSLAWTIVIGAIIIFYGSPRSRRRKTMHGKGYRAVFNLDNSVTFFLRRPRSDNCQVDF